jgi:hypothetical protein
MRPEMSLVSRVERELAILQVGQLRMRLFDQLPSYMVPTVWAVVEALPMTTSGKLDWRTVGKWVEEMVPDTHRTVMALTDGDTVEPPVTSAEQLLQRVCSEVLSRPAAGISIGVGS